MTLPVYNLEDTGLKKQILQSYYSYYEAEENELTERETTIFKMIKANNKLTVEEVMAVLDISRATVFRDYAKIRKKCGVSYDKKAGEWKL